MTFAFRGLKRFYVDVKAAGAALELVRLVVELNKTTAVSTDAILARLQAPFLIQTVAKAHPDSFEVVRCERSGYTLPPAPEILLCSFCPPAGRSDHWCCPTPLPIRSCARHRCHVPRR